MRRRAVFLLGALGLLVGLVLLFLGPRLRKAEAPPAGSRPIRLEPEGGGAALVGDGASTRLRAIVTEVPSALSWRVSVPAGARLETFLSFARERLEELAGLVCRAEVKALDEGGRARVLLEREVRPDPAWEAYEVDLSAHAGSGIELRVELSCPGAPRTFPAAARWSVPLISPPRRPGELSVLLVSIDTLRADHLSAYGYARPTSPHIDALARRGLLFEAAETVQSATWPALTSLHTALYPGAHGVRWNGHRLPEGLLTLAQVLEAEGFSTSAFITNMTRGRHPGFSRLFLSRGGGQLEVDRAAVAQAVAQLERERDRRFFMWVHLLSPHADYAPPAPHRRSFTRPGASSLQGRLEELVDVRRRGVALTEADVAHVVGLYDGEVAFVDALVGRLLSALAEKGLERTTLVVLTADHGEDLHEHNRYFFHSPSVYASSMRIPLVLALPGVLPEGARTDHPASLVDVAPTILGLLGLSVPPAFQGEHLLPGRSLPPRPVRRLAFGETHGRVFTVRSPEWRFVYNPERLAPPAPGGPYPIDEAELYDQRNDPRETRNLVPARPDLVRALTAEILAHQSRTGRKDLLTPGLDPEALEELRALGYLAN
jgi:arylsulfatase A-like enzyme